jgi:hypothetical protein
VTVVLAALTLAAGNLFADTAPPMLALERGGRAPKLTEKPPPARGGEAEVIYHPPPPATPEGNRALGRRMALARGWSTGDFACIDVLWGSRESGWDESAHNPSSGAHGIPQALPASKMATHGADYWTNPTVQIEWGYDYVDGRYGGPCPALAHSNSTGWY